MAYLRSRPVLISLTILLAVAAGLVVRQQRLLQTSTAALVNGERISIEPTNKLIEKMKAKDPARFRGEAGLQKEVALKKEMVDSRVQLRIISQAARAAGIDVGNDDIDKEIRIQSTSYGSEAQFYQAKAAQGYSARETRDEVRDLLAKQRMREKLAREAAVAQREVISYIAANKEHLESETQQVRLTEVKVTGAGQFRELSEGDREGRVAERAKQRGLPVESYWQRKQLLEHKLRDAFLQAGARGVVSPFPHPDNTLSMYEVHEWRVRQSDEDELQRQVKRKLLSDKQQGSFARWLATIQGSAEVRIFD